MLSKISLALVGLTVGSILTVVGFASYALDMLGFVPYALDYATLNLAGFFYGIPLLLGGLALKAAELKPIPFSQPTPETILKLRKTLATSTQNQIRKDVTRYRYGQDAHLDDALQRLGLSPTDEERPLLVSIQESAIADHYALTLAFQSPFISLETWQEKKEKIEKFFGPDIRVNLEQTDDKKIELALISQLV
jgi:hypothetical protein